jgi:3-phenylpropionate/cinnamic acid dioxygenase small subunit
MALDSQALLQIDKILLDHIAALDGKDMKRWLETFAEDDNAGYFCLSQENAEQGLALGFMYDDCHARLRDRVTFVTEIWAGTFQDYRTRHFVQRVEANEIGNGDVAVKSNFSVFMTPEDTGVSEILATGVYEDVIRLGNGEARILTRRALLDTSVLPRYLVYPI